MKKSIQPQPRSDSMDEVIALEKEIKQNLTRRGKDKNLIHDAEAILAGRPTMVSGTRLDRLRLIAGELRKG